MNAHGSWPTVLLSWERRPLPILSISLSIHPAQSEGNYRCACHKVWNCGCCEPVNTTRPHPTHAKFHSQSHSSVTLGKKTPRIAILLWRGRSTYPSGNPVCNLDPSKLNSSQDSVKTRLCSTSFVRVHFLKITPQTWTGNPEHNPLPHLTSTTHVGQKTERERARYREIDR